MTTTNLHRRRWTDADFDRLLVLRRDGLSIAQVAEEFGVAKTTIEDHVKRRKRRDPAWAELYATAHPQPVTREPMPSTRSAAEARFEARAAELLAACRRVIGEYGEIRGTARLASELGWRSHSVSNLIHSLRIRGRFPYDVAHPGRAGGNDIQRDDELSAEGIAEGNTSGPPPNDLESAIKAVREAKIMRTLDDPGQAPVGDYHGPTMTPETAEATRFETVRENVKRYVREWKARRKSGMAAPHGPEHYREAQEIGLEAMYERTRRNRRLAVA